MRIRNANVQTVIQLAITGKTYSEICDFLKIEPAKLDKLIGDSIVLNQILSNNEDEGNKQEWDIAKEELKKVAEAQSLDYIIANPTEKTSIEMLKMISKEQNIKNIGSSIQFVDNLGDADSIE